MGVGRARGRIMGAFAFCFLYVASFFSRIIFFLLYFFLLIVMPIFRYAFTMLFSFSLFLSVSVCGWNFSWVEELEWVAGAVDTRQPHQVTTRTNLCSCALSGK